jgi:hypothetical protein
MGEIIDMRAWRREREPRHRQEDRLCRAMARIERATDGMLLRRAPQWLVRGVRRAKGLLDAGNLGEAADLTETLAARIERRGTG